MLEPVERISEDNIDYFASLYDKYKSKVYNSAFLIIKDKQLAEDIMQDVFIKAFKNYHNLKSIDLFEHWISKITYNHCINYINKNKKLINKCSFDENMNLENNPTYLPEDIYLNSEFSNDVFLIISKLPVKHYETVILYYYLELSISEIASTMKCLKGTVKSRLFYSRNYIKEELQSLKGG